jgi:hypothetical protein
MHQLLQISTPLAPVSSSHQAGAGLARWIHMPGKGDPRHDLHLL